jgi:hypothetical protein
MTQRDLNRAVATATGESVRSIAHQGFSLLTAGPVEREREPLDWDNLDDGRIGVLFPRRRTPAAAF